MRLAIDIRSLIEGRHTGVQEYTLNIIWALHRHAPEHAYHLFYNAYRPVELPALPPALPVHAFRYPNKLLNAAQWSLHIPRWDKLVPADCFFVPSFRLLPLSPATPLVTTVHDLSFEYFPEFFSRRRRLWHRLMRPQQLMANSDRLLAVSHATADDIVSTYGIPPDKISVVYSGATSQALPTAEAVRHVRERYHLPDRFILYFGTLEPRKNIVGIIAAFSAIAHGVPQHLVLAGARGWLTDAIDAAVAASPARDRIHLPGFIAEADKAALYASADLFVYPSFYEGFGFPPLESLLAGTPVITSQNSALPEIVGEYTTLMNPYDRAELALLMRELLSDLPIVTEQTRRDIIQKYSWEKAAEQTLSAIQSVV